MNITSCLCLFVFLQLIYDAGVPFTVIMWTWAGLASLVWLNCFLNWPVEGFATPEEIMLVQHFCYLYNPQ